MFCHNCGSKLPDDSRFCSNCGAEQLMEEPAAQPAPEPVPQPAPEPEKPGAHEMRVRFPDFEPGPDEAAEPGPAEPQPPAAPLPPSGAFTWEHVTVSGEFTNGKGTITIHFE